MADKKLAGRPESQKLTIDHRSYLDVVIKLLTSVPPGTIKNFPTSLMAFLNHNELSATAYDTVIEICEWRKHFRHEEIEKLKVSKHQAIARHKLAKTALRDALTVLAGYNYIYFKGMLAAYYYPDPQNRHPGDLDILVQIDQFDAIVEKFRENGWILQRSVHWKREKNIAEKYGFALVLRHPSIPIILDLHRAVVDRTEPFWIPTELLLKHKRILSLDNNLKVYVPSNEDHLAILSLHSVRHAFFRITWFYDLFCLLNSSEFVLNEDLFKERISDWKISKAVNTGIALTQKIFRFKSKSYRVDTTTSDIARALYRRPPSLIMRGKEKSPRSLQRVSGLIDLMDNRLDGLNYLKRLSFPERDLIREQDDAEISLKRYILNRLSSAFRTRR